MLPIDRLKKIEAVLIENGSIVISKLSASFGVSEETIRRDLEKISKTLKIRRVHGGAYLVKSGDKEVPVKIRESIYVEEKQLIGQKALSLIEQEDTIILDCSTTALFIAKALNSSDKRITVLTNSMKVVSELSDNDRIRLVCLGGRFRKATGSFIGTTAYHQLEGLAADKAFVSCTSIHPEFGITDNHEDEAALRQLMVKRSQATILVIDHTKFEKPATFKICELTDLNTVILDKKVSENSISPLTEEGIEIIYCE